MNNLKLRLIEKSEWKLQPNVDEKGFTKCIELDGYKYVYVDPKGKVHDLRPKENRPSYNNYIKLPEEQLYEILIKCLKKQISELEGDLSYSVEDKEVLKNLKEELREAENNYSRLN